MEEKKRKIRLIPGFLILGLTLILYVGMAAFYGGFSRNIDDHRFIFGTWINGYYATGLTAAELNENLTKDDDGGVFTIIDNWGTKSYVPLENIGFEMDYTQILNSMLSKQNPFLWFTGIPMGLSYRLDPEYSYNEEMFKDKVTKAALFNQFNADMIDADIELKYDDKDGFYLYEDTEDSLDSARTLENISEAVLSGEKSYTVQDSDLNKRTISKKDKETLELWEKIKVAQDIEITYDFGDESYCLTPGIVSKWFIGEDGEILLDDDLNIVYRDGCVEEFVDSLAEVCDTYMKPREFMTTAGDSITIDSSYIGTKVNKSAEVKYLKEALEEHKRETRLPEYSKNIGTTCIDGVGQTYIEVDKTNQTLYYYVDGELIVETPVVTGCTGNGHGTPTMISPICSKETDRYLIGPGYKSFVHYWMHVRNGIGIHDAMWRSEFGGEIYKWGGSHGCINTPDDAMITLFEQVPLGTIVVIY